MLTKTNLSEISLQRLNDCHPSLNILVNAVSLVVPVLVMVGHRGEIEQNEAFSTGHSKQTWPNSKHNKLPSLAVDLTICPYDPNNFPRLQYFAGLVLGIASQLKIPIRWGGDWNQNSDPSDERFKDLFHFELTA